MTTTEFKIPLSCRVYPELKAVIEEEAFEEGLTTSMYLEKIIVNRHEPAEKEEAEFVNVYQFEVEIEELKALVETLQSENAGLLHQNQNLTEKNNLLERKSRLVHLVDFDAPEEEKFERMLEKLRLQYPGKEDKQLLLACLHAAVKNEESVFFIHTLGGYLE